MRCSLWCTVSFFFLQFSAACAILKNRLVLLDQGIRKMSLFLQMKKNIATRHQKINLTAKVFQFYIALANILDVWWVSLICLFTLPFEAFCAIIMDSYIQLPEFNIIPFSKKYSRRWSNPSESSCGNESKLQIGKREKDVTLNRFQKEGPHAASINTISSACLIFEAFQLIQFSTIRLFKWVLCG
jgi:hypothetical protein